MRDLLLAYARALVERPGRVSVEERAAEGDLLLELSVAPEDRGRVIGRRGRTAEALRTVLSAVARRRGTRCELEILG
jgi:predicted RNA-binding protein YlqC (UPF0109 family)